MSRFAVRLPHGRGVALRTHPILCHLRYSADTEGGDGLTWGAVVSTGDPLVTSRSIFPLLRVAPVVAPTRFDGTGVNARLACVPRLVCYVWPFRMCVCARCVDACLCSDLRRATVAISGGPAQRFMAPPSPPGAAPSGRALGEASCGSRYHLDLDTGAAHNHKA